MRWQRTTIDDRLLADLAPARVGCRVIHRGGLGLDDVARSEVGKELRRLRILGVVGFFHRVEMVEYAIEFVEAVDRGQILVAVTEMVFTDLSRGVAVSLQQFSDCRILVL